MALAAPRLLEGFLILLVVSILLVISNVLPFNESNTFPQSRTVTKQGPESGSNISVSKEVREGAVTTQNRRVMRVLYWTTFRGFSDFSAGFGRIPFASCKVPQCTATASRVHLKSADVVLFHAPDLAHRKTDLPRWRHGRQLYVFFLRESPVNTFLNLRQFSGFFNLSMTYSRDSDIRFPYGYIEERTSQPYVPYDPGIVTSRSKIAVAIISNCKATGRLDLIRALQRHIDVSLYGRCGGRDVSGCFRNQTCTRDLIAQHKFYLAFENSACRDYVTEKVYKVLDLPVIPIVFGGANYRDILPPNSYIDVQDFLSAKALADHLTYLAHDSKAYMAHFEWRRSYISTSRIEFWKKPAFIKMDTRAMCHLCEVVHEVSGQKHVIQDLESFWGIKQNCVNTDAWVQKFIAE